MFVQFFDHIFYRVYLWNLKVVKEKEFPIYSSVLGVALFYYLNVSTVLFAILLFAFNDTGIFSKSEHLIGSIIVLIVTYLAYVKSGRYKKILGEAKQLSRKTIRKLDIVITIYIILTFVSFIWIILEGRKYNLLE